MWSKPLAKRLKNWLIYHVIRSVIWMVRRLPRYVVLRLFELLGSATFWLAPGERAKILRHLEIAFGPQLNRDQIRTLGKQSMKALGRNVADALRLPCLVRDGLEQHVHFVGREHLDRAVARGKGVLCVTGHMGCWELLATFVASHYPLAVVGADIYDPRLNEILLVERQSSGYESFPRTAAGTRRILRWLKSGGVLGILIDQDTRVDGEFVDFFGKAAHTPSGPVILAERTGAALVPIAIRMNADRSHTVEARREIELQRTGEPQADRLANVAKCSKAVEGFIRRTPEQWVWMHERWKTRPVEQSALTEN